MRTTELAQSLRFEHRQKAAGEDERIGLLLRLACGDDDQFDLRTGGAAHPRDAFRQAAARRWDHGFARLTKLQNLVPRLETAIFTGRSVRHKEVDDLSAI